MLSKGSMKTDKNTRKAASNTHKAAETQNIELFLMQNTVKDDSHSPQECYAFLVTTDKKG